MTVLVHLVEPAAWRAALDTRALRPPSLADQGSLHLSTPEQAHLPAERLFPGRRDLVLLVVDPARLPDPVRWKPGRRSRPGSRPQLAKGGEDGVLLLHGPLPVTAVVAVVPHRPPVEPVLPEPDDALGRALALQLSLPVRRAAEVRDVPGGMAVLDGALPTLAGRQPAGAHRAGGRRHRGDDDRGGGRHGRLAAPGRGAALARRRTGRRRTGRTRLGGRGAAGRGQAGRTAAGWRARRGGRPVRAALLLGPLLAAGPRAAPGPGHGGRPAHRPGAPQRRGRRGDRRGSPGGRPGGGRRAAAGGRRDGRRRVGGDRTGVPRARARRRRPRPAAHAGRGRRLRPRGAAGRRRRLAAAVVRPPRLRRRRLDLGRRPAGSGSGRRDHREQQVGDGRRGQHGVQPVHDPAVAGQQVPHVLEAEVALDQRLAEVARGRADRERGAEEDAAPPRPVEGERHDRGGDQHTGDHRAGHALPRLLGAHRRRHGVLAEQHTGGEAADVVADHRGHERQYPRRAVVRDQQQDGEPGQQRHVQRDQDAGRGVPQVALGAITQPPQQDGENGEQETHDQPGGAPVPGEGGHRHGADQDRHQRRVGTPGLEGTGQLHHTHEDRDEQHQQERRPVDQQREEDDRGQADADADGGDHVPAGATGGLGRSAVPGPGVPRGLRIGAGATGRAVLRAAGELGGRRLVDGEARGP
ncbi:DUF952 domain-containing protein [Geodermatophilus sp. DF01-2]|nr:DUF952 domain-containing protein [Geodermatophilus sp. DF01_2]